METNKSKIDLIQRAIQQLIQSKQDLLLTPQTQTEAETETFCSVNDHFVVDDDDDQQLLTKLLSQLESLKRDGIVKCETSDKTVQLPPFTESETDMNSKNETDTSTRNSADVAEDVIKELKKVESQNRTTHWLLSTLILLTLAWQLSEVSLLLNLKDRLTHPLKSIGNMIKPPKILETDPDNQSSSVGNMVSAIQTEPGNPLSSIRNMIAGIFKRSKTNETDPQNQLSSTIQKGLGDE